MSTSTTTIVESEFEKAFLGLANEYLDTNSVIDTGCMEDFMRENPTACATMQLVDPDVTAMLVLATDATTCHQLGADTGCVSEWVAELCNQLAGRLKSLLYVYGRSFDIGVPTTLSPQELENQPTSASFKVLHANCPDATLFACCSYQIINDVSWELDEAAEVNEEGSVQLF